MLKLADLPVVKSYANLVVQPSEPQHKLMKGLRKLNLTGALVLRHEEWYLMSLKTQLHISAGSHQCFSAAYAKVLFIFYNKLPIDNYKMKSF